MSKKQRANYEIMNSRARRNRLDGGSEQLNRIYVRDQGICQLCGNFCERVDASRDHIKDFALCTPEEAKSDDNVQLAHLECNNRKHHLPKSVIRVINPHRSHLTYTIGSVFPELGSIIKITSQKPELIIQQDETKRGKMPEKSIRAMLMDHFKAHPNEEVTLQDLIESTGGLLAVQVQGNISNIMRADKYGKLDFHIDRVRLGQVWVYRPDVKTQVQVETEVEPELEESEDDEYSWFKQIAITKKGTIIIQGEDGNLYKAEELDI